MSWLLAKRAGALALALACFGYSHWSMSSPSYRYVDDSGVTVHVRSMPPEYIARGYTVISESGRVLEVIPPALSEKEVEKRKEELALVEEQRRLEEEQRQSDLNILKLYSEPADAVRACERKVAEIEFVIGGREAELLTLRARRGELRRQAADLERVGSPVDSQLISRLGSLEERMAQINGFIEDKRQEQEDVRESYKAVVIRLQELLGYEKDETIFEHSREDSTRPALTQQ